MAATSIAKRNRTSRTDPDTKLYWKIRRAGPALTNVQAERFENMEQNPERHGWRRMAFAVLSMPCEELFGKIESDREAAVALADAAQGIRGYMKSMRALADIIDKAQLRIEMGLCKRDDYEEIFAEAKVEPKARLFRMNTSGAVHG